MPTLDEPGAGADPEPSLAERLHDMRWNSLTPVSDLTRSMVDLAAQGESLRVPDRFSFGELVISLRATKFVPLALALLTPSGDNEWARPLLAELQRLAGHTDAAIELLERERQVLLLHSEPIQERWLHLAARLGRDALRSLTSDLAGSAVLDRYPFELDLGEALSAERRSAFAERLSAQQDAQPLAARRCVDLLAHRMESGARFRSQVVTWGDWDTYDPAILARIVDSSLAAADEGVGYSCIRLGDGEGLAMIGELPDLGGVLGMDSDYEWVELEEPEYARFQRLLAGSMRNADVVGVPDIVQCLTGPVGYVDAVLTCVDAGTATERILPGGCDFGWALEISGEVDRLLARCTGLIGPVDPRVLRRMPPDREIAWLPVPGELLYYWAENPETTHWDTFDRIRGHDFQPGELWMVGAGILGKVYCDAIKARGAVAVDIGSVLDVWSGRQDTRGTVRGQPWVAAPYVEQA